MLEAADERWIDEHGFDVDNPLFDQIKHASDLLRANPEDRSPWPLPDPSSRRYADCIEQQNV